MSFVHKRSTRHPLNWFFAVITTFLGIPITLFFGIGIIYDGIDFGPLLGLTLGLGFSAAGLYLIYLIMVPKEFTRIISNEMIVCKLNGVVTHQFKKEDIKMIYIHSGETGSVDIEMKNNETLGLPDNYFMNLASFRQELMMCGYRVYE